LQRRGSYQVHLGVAEAVLKVARDVMTHQIDPTQTFSAEVAAISEPVPAIRILELKGTNGDALPNFDPGAHVSVRIPPNEADRPIELWRSYSLIAFPEELETSGSVSGYRIGVLREEDGKGGSRYMHDEVRVGDVLTLRLPPNTFVLDEKREGIQFVAGGIGITPLITMAAAVSRAGRRSTLHYVCRSEDKHLFTERLVTIPGCALRIHVSSDPMQAFSVPTFLRGLKGKPPIYVCGPARLIDAVTKGATAAGWDKSHVHSESFEEAGPLEGDEPFEVELANSGQVLTVPADQTLLDVLDASGAMVLYDCRQGDCGLCSVGVKSGEIIHRDIFLSDEEKAAGNVMQVCVSRGKGRLVLDM
jgi:ferredoxin-NADP reductase